MFQKADLDKIATLAEFEGFTQTMFEKSKSYREMIDVKVIKSTDQEEIKHLRKQRQQYPTFMTFTTQIPYFKNYTLLQVTLFTDYFST